MKYQKINQILILAGMVPAPDPNCELNISSFLTLPHPSDCLICANDIMIIVLLQQIMGGWEGWGVGGGGWFIDIKVWVGGRGWVS